MAQGVTIPVSLELKNLQKTIQELESQLSKVKPGTKISNDLTRQIDKAKRDYAALEVAASRSYSKVGEVERFGNSFRKITNEVAATAKMMERLGFDTLVFSDADLSGIKTVNSQIEQLKTNMASLKTDAIRNLFKNSQDVQDTFSKMHIAPDTYSLEKTTREVERHVDRLRKAVASRDEALNGRTAKKAIADNAATELSNLKQTITQLNNPEFFASNQRFKAGGKDKFKTWLRSLGLDDASIDLLIQNGAQKMLAAYDQIEKIVNDRAQRHRDTSTRLQSEINAINTTKADETKQLNSASETLKGLRGIPTDANFIAQLESYKQQIADLNAQIEELKAKAVALNGPARDTEKIMQALGITMSSADGRISDAAASLQRMAESSRQFDHLKTMITQWFGMYRVIGMVRNVITKAIKNIKELDDVMTEIAVVTQMTQKDLWAQMDTYSAIANQYAVSIKGVYEVSQLWYQQGSIT